MKAAALFTLLLLSVACWPHDASAKDSPAAKPAFWQRGAGQPYEVADSTVWDVPDPVSGRAYQVFVALPPSYADQPQRRYPVLYVTDADYAFPIVRQIARRLNGEGPAVEEFILVGLSYAKGDGGMHSRRRDYTPTPAGTKDAPAGDIHGESTAYIAYLRDGVVPFIASRYRTDEQRRLFLGHSYGGLLGAEILLSDPRLFNGYILGSPSLWYDKRYMLGREVAYSTRHKDLPARVYMYIGEYEEVRKGDPRYARTYNMVSDTKALESALKSRHYPSLKMRVDILNNENHLTVAPRGFTQGLLYLLPDPRRS